MYNCSMNTIENLTRLESIKIESNKILGLKITVTKIIHKVFRFHSRLRRNSENSRDDWLV